MESDQRLFFHSDMVLEYIVRHSSQFETMICGDTVYNYNVYLFKTKSNWIIVSFIPNELINKARIICKATGKYALLVTEFVLTINKHNQMSHKKNPNLT